MIKRRNAKCENNDWIRKRVGGLNGKVETWGVVYWRLDGRGTKHELGKGCKLFYRVNIPSGHMYIFPQKSKPADDLQEQQ